MGLVSGAGDVRGQGQGNELSGMCLCRAAAAQLCLCSPSIAQDAVHGVGRSTLQTHETLSSLTCPARPCFKLLCSIRQLAAPLP